jgi:general nucleoside transport system permease protein
MATTVSEPVASAPAAPRATWRDRIRITRTGVFSVLFIVVGIWLLINAPKAFTPDTITTLTFGTDLPTLPVHTLPYTTVVAILYLVGGFAGLVAGFTNVSAPPVAGAIVKRGEKATRAAKTPLERVANIWLIINGLLIIPTVLIIAAAGQSTNVTVMLQGSLRLATPVAMGALAGLWCERSGVVNIAIEGMMLTGALFGFVVTSLVSSTTDLTAAQALWVGVLAATLSGGIMAMLHAWLSITYKTDQVVSGTVINILAVGITSFIRREVLFSSEAGRETLQRVDFGKLAEIPVIGPVLFSGKPIFYCMFILLIVTHVVLFYTRWGLRTRAVGENPHAADTLGINVLRNRWINVVIGGLIAGLAGAWFSLETTGSFDDNMTSGRGFIGLAAMIFGKYTPFGAFAGAVLFGFSDILGQRFQSLGVQIPTQFLQMVPYVITIIVLAGLVGRAVAPKADGIPYEKEGK